MTNAIVSPVAAVALVVGGCPVGRRNCGGGSPAFVRCRWQRAEVKSQCSTRSWRSGTKTGEPHENRIARRGRH
jgi:hypothetical protein